MNAQTASAMFDTEAGAQRAVADLRVAGTPDRALSVVTRHGDVTTTADADGEIVHQEQGSVARVIRSDRRRRRLSTKRRVTLIGGPRRA